MATINSIRQVIKAEIARAIASHVAANLASLGPLGLPVAAAAGAAASALFDAIIPKFRIPDPPAFAKGTPFYGAVPFYLI